MFPHSLLFQTPKVHYKLSRDVTPHTPSYLVHNNGYVKFLAGKNNLFIAGSLDTLMFIAMNMHTKPLSLLFVFCYSHTGKSLFCINFQYMQYFPEIPKLLTTALGWWMWKTAFTHLRISYTWFTLAEYGKMLNDSARTVM